MTDISHRTAIAAPDRVGSARRVWPFMPYAVAFAAGAAGLVAGRAMAGNADAYESTLRVLLQFMAAMKFAGVLAAAAVTHWRLTQPIGQRLARGYLATLVPMAAAPGLIWSLGGIALGALLFHAGLLAFLYLAWTDNSVRLPGRG